jgi:hypothetical protein
MVYLDRRGEITQRRIKVLDVKEGIIKAYCLEHKAPRVFKENSVLAALPINLRFRRGTA